MATHFHETLRRMEMNVDAVELSGPGYYRLPPQRVCDAILALLLTFLEAGALLLCLFLWYLATPQPDGSPGAMHVHWGPLLTVVAATAGIAVFASYLRRRDLWITAVVQWAAALALGVWTVFNAASVLY